MFTQKELKIIKKLNTPSKIQDFLNKLNPNISNGKYNDTCNSPKLVLKYKKAHCIEGAIFAAAVLRYHNQEPLILDLEATKKDYDHVIALFKRNNKWGAISKTNHTVLRYRDAIYKNIRELVMSYFHEYTDNNGNKTLRRFSNPINLKIFDKYNWMESEDEVWYIPEYLTKVKHHEILTKKEIKNLRKADKIEIKVGKLREWRN
ncbi:MAG: hypothetical protein QW117_02020 [Candidatus Pacearchaeota archaeon]